MIDRTPEIPIIRPLGPVTVRRLGAPGFRKTPVMAGGNSNDIEEQASWRA